MKTRISLLTAVLFAAGLSVSLPAQAENLLGLYREAVDADAAYLGAQADAKALREMGPQALAKLLPNVSFSGNRLKHSVTTPGTTVFGMRTPDKTERFNAHSYSLGVNQPLFRAASFAAWKQSQALVEGVDADLLWAEQQVGTRLS
ncbi:MAG: TolC family protein, partial [Betaproteobacteria bacterium]|nr:TolC family protein [Betaproteobacteria bacterium]